MTAWMIRYMKIYSYSREEMCKGDHIVYEIKKISDKQQNKS